MDSWCLSLKITLFLALPHIRDQKRGRYIIKKTDIGSGNLPFLETGKHQNVCIHMSGTQAQRIQAVFNKMFLLPESALISFKIMCKVFFLGKTSLAERKVLS